LNVLHILWHVSYELQCHCVYSLNIHALMSSLIDHHHHHVPEGLGMFPVL